MVDTVRDILMDEKLDAEAKAIKLNEIPGYKIEPIVNELEFPLYGKATAYNQNCSFHCLAETLFYLPDEKLKIIADQFPGFQYICDAFAEFYQKECDIDEPIDLAFITAFNQKILHPYDFQMLWGPLLRLAFQKYMDENAFEFTYGFKNDNLMWNPAEAISPDALGAFIGAFGGRIHIDNEHEPNEKYRKELADGFGFPVPCWEVKVKLERRQKEDGSYYASGHYIFEVPPTTKNLYRQSDRDAMLVPEKRKAHQEWSDWYNEQGQEQRGLRWIIDDELGFLIPADNSRSILEELSNQFHGKRFHEIKGEWGEDGRALRADLLKKFVRATHNMKPMDPEIFETGQDIETGGESTQYPQNPENHFNKPSIFDQIIDAVQTFVFAAVSAFKSVFFGFFFSEQTPNTPSNPKKEAQQYNDSAHDEGHKKDMGVGELNFKKGLLHQAKANQKQSTVKKQDDDLEQHIDLNLDSSLNQKFKTKTPTMT